VLWNLKGLAQPPPAICFAVLGLTYMPRTCPLASLFLLLTGYLVLVAVVFIGDPRYHFALIPLAFIRLLRQGRLLDGVLDSERAQECQEISALLLGQLVSLQVLAVKI
jgi:hypothetical protein